MICPHCQKDDVKNLPAHLRFCPAKKEQPISPEMVLDEDKKITADNIAAVEEYLKEDDSVEVEKTDEIPVVTAVNCSAITFNFPADVWRKTLETAIESLTGNIRIDLKHPLGHEFVDLGGSYIYPSDVFYTILRNYCDNITTDNEGRIFYCTRKTQV